ncbi:MAG: hypothetical protein ACRD0L_10580, partial [Acidimicrobiales bacterium]
TTAHTDLDGVVVRAREAASVAGELPERPSGAEPVRLPEEINLGTWLSEMVRSGEWAEMMKEITAEDHELADELPPT